MSKSVRPPYIYFCSIGSLVIRQELRVDGAVAEWNKLFDYCVILFIFSAAIFHKKTITVFKKREDQHVFISATSDPW